MVTNRFPDLRPGDQLFAQGTSLLDRGIILASEYLPDRWRSPMRGGFVADHVAIVYDSLILNEAVGRIRLAPLAEYTNTEVEVWRYNSMTSGMAERYKEVLVSDWNQVYGWGKMGLFLMDSAFRTYYFTQRFGVTSFKVCSNQSAWAWQRAFGREMVPGMPWQTVSPQVLRDWCVASHEWTLVYKTPTITSNNRSAVVSESYRAMNSPSALALLQVQDTLTALHKLATNYRRPAFLS